MEPDKIQPETRQSTAWLAVGATRFSQSSHYSESPAPPFGCTQRSISGGGIRPDSWGRSSPRDIVSYKRAPDRRGSLPRVGRAAEWTPKSQESQFTGASLSRPQPRGGARRSPPGSRVEAALARLRRGSFCDEPPKSDAPPPDAPRDTLLHVRPDLYT